MDISEFAMTNPYLSGFFLLSGIVIIYLAAKALMRYLEKKREKN